MFIRGGDLQTLTQHSWQCVLQLKKKKVMGSIQVYDTSVHQWDLCVQDVDKWVRHFADIQAGRVRPDHKGRYIVRSGSRTNPEANRSDRNANQLKVNLVTPVAQVIEMAKSELKRESKSIRENGVPPGESCK